MYKQLSICDVEAVYLKRLAAYLSRKPEFSWRIKTYVDLELCLKERPEVLIVSGCALEQWKKKKNLLNDPEILGCQFIFLEDDTEKINSWPVVKKYQSAGSLYEDLLEILAEDMKLETEILAVYGPSDSVAAEILAQEVGKKYLDKGEVLIISLTEYSVLCEGVFNRKGIEDWFYYNTQQAQEKRKLSEWTYERDGVNYLYGFRTVYDQKGIELKDWQNFLKEGIRKSPYRTVILVFDRMPDYLELFLWCDSIYVQWGHDGYENIRKDKFEKMASYMEMKELIKKLVEV